MAKTRKKSSTPISKDKTSKANKKLEKKIIAQPAQDVAKSDNAKTRLCFVKLRRIKLQPLTSAALPFAMRRQKETRTAAGRDQRVDTSASTAPSVKAQAPKLPHSVPRMCAVNLRRSKMSALATTVEHARREPITKKGSPAALREQRVNPSASAACALKQQARTPTLERLDVRVKQTTTNDQAPHSKLQRNATHSGYKRNDIRGKENVMKTPGENACEQVRNELKQLSIPAEENASTCVGRRLRERAQYTSTTVSKEKQKNDLHESFRKNALPIKQLSISERNGLKKLSLSGVSTCTATGNIVENKIPRTNTAEKVTQHQHRTTKAADRTNAKKGADGGGNDMSTASENSQHNTSAKNFANNKDAIEKILLSEEEDEVTSKETNVKSKATEKLASASAVTAAGKTEKFFHRTAAPAVSNKCNSKARPQVVAMVRTRRSRPRYTRGCHISERNIYEFLSQSQTSDSDPGKHIDPAADVIQKLIAEGKVRVATTRKGTGRPVMKRVSKRVVKKRAAPVKRALGKKNMAEKAAPTAVEVDDFDFGVASFSPPHSPVAEEQEVEENAAVGTFPTVKANNHNQSVDGTFSRLARSVLLQQADKNGSVRKRSLMDQQRLLDIARKFVSTPVNRAKNATLQTADISPIAAPKLIATNNNAINGSASPWRVPDDAHLPSVFNFSKNSSQLPSFSSDFIPPTPRKKVQFEDSHKHDSSLAPLEYTDVASTSAQAKANASLAQQTSSFTSNDSDAENVPPVPHASTGAVVGVDTNADIFNLRQQPNPRRTYSHRSPLKAINILEVVTLPPWQSTVSNSRAEDAAKPAENEKSSHTNDESNIEHLFGFDEFIDDDESGEEAQSKLTEASLATSYVDPKNLRKKLRDLKKWRPAVENLLHEKPKTVKPIRRIYDDGEGGQRRIKEMFCSTMINQRKTKETRISDSDEDEECNNGQRRNANNAEVGLFNDPDTTFNEMQSRRTYGRQYKKKRKLPHNFVMFLDSDESGEEEGAEEDHSYEQIKSDEKEKKRTRKRHKAVRNEEEANPELESFAHDFNDMCKEVEQYELIVE